MSTRKRTHPSQAPVSTGESGASPRLLIRPLKAVDLDEVISIDAEATGIEKIEYWHELFRHYRSHRQQRFFLVAEVGGIAGGFVLGEVRDWEFGAPPCGWVFGMGVRRDLRLGGIGGALFGAMIECFRGVGVEKVHTITGRDNNLMLSFFRSQGMMAAPVIPLELDLR